jgi:DNA-binding transcriptional ArsR family regulator
LRWRILTTLASGERNVGELEAATGIMQPGLSQQLGVLRKAGLVETRKEAKLVFYAIAGKQIEGTVASITRIVPELSITEERSATAETPAPGAANFARIF